MSLDAATGKINSSLIGGQGTYIPQFVVTDSTGAQAIKNISFAINGSNVFLAGIFPSNFHLSPSSGRSHDKLARGYFSRGAYVQCLLDGDDQTVLR